MGFYIQGPLVGKADFLMERYNADIVSMTRAQQLVGDDKLAVICLVDNGPFEAAAYCYDAREFAGFTHPEDMRPKLWMTMDKETVHRLVEW